MFFFAGTSKNQEKNNSKKRNAIFFFAGTGKNQENNNFRKGGKYFSLKQLVRVKKRLMHKKIYKKIIITLALCDASFFGAGSLSLLFVEFYFCLFFCYIFVALHFNIDIIIPQIILVH